MLVLPVDEAAWGFRVCLYVGMALLVLDVVLPHVFGRRVRLRWPFRRPPRLALPRVRPMTDDRFRRRRRELERKIRALERGEDARDDQEAAAEKSDGATADESDARRLAKEKKVLKKKKVKRRVKMAGDKTETEGDESDAAGLRRRSGKRVSFGESRKEHRQRPPLDEETKSHDSPTVEIVQPIQRAASPAATEATAVPSPPRVAPISTGQQDAAPPKSPTRPDPFSLVDDDFPWQLPNYARMAPAPSATAAQATQSTVSASPVAPHGITLNVRRPLGHCNGPTQPRGSSPAAQSVGNSKFTLELKHKPFWKRTPTKGHSPSTAKSSMRGTHAPSLDEPLLSAAGTVSTVPRNSFVSASSISNSAVTARSTGSEEPRLLFRPDSVLRPSPVPQRQQRNAFVSKGWRVPSPKPPLHSRPAVAAQAATSTSHVSTPVAPQSKLKTPKIIRRITFDEDMMCAMATPSDASPLITESTRKRQRENDVLEALDAVGIPWHNKRRSHH